MGPTGKSIATLLVATLFACGAVLSTAIATATESPSTTTAKPVTPAKKKSVIHKPVPRPNPPEATAPAATKTANGSQGVSLGLPTTSRKALGLPLPKAPAQAPRQVVTFGHAPVVGAGHGLGTATVHVAQNNLHLELKP
jgi:hypothetical protein